jgi:hypothetical protein
MNKMKKVYIMLVLFLTGIMAEAQTSVWDGSRRLWTRGTGTENDPYLIETAANLAFLSYMVNKNFDTQGLHFRLTTDIDLNGSEDQPWKPIGLYDRGFDEDGCDRGSLNSIGFSPYSAFRGHFDGDGHSISNIYIDSEYAYAGMFGYADSRTEEMAIIENVFVSNGYIRGGTCGGIVGYGERLVVSHCRNVATIEGQNVGGVVGNGSPKVIKCSNAGQLSGFNVGGIVGGAVSKAEIEECYNEGDITASRSAGGILSQSQKATLENCYNTGTVAAIGDTSTYFPNAGGLVGIASRLEARNCYNVGEITGNQNVGCLIGYVGLYENVSVENCYYLNNCYGSSFGIPKNAEEMRDNAFVDVLNQNPAVWGFDANNVNDGFPILTRTDLSVNEITGSGPTLYPNPTKKIVKIEGIEPAEVQVYNALGQLMKTFYHTNAIDLGSMPKGIYALHVLGSDGAFAAFKVVKE